MAKILQHRRGTATEHANFVGAEGEFTYDTSEKRLRVHDGSTKGGVSLAKVSEVNQVQTNLNNAKTELQNKVNEVAANAGDAFQEDILEAANKAGTAQINNEPSSLQEILTRIATLEANLSNQITAFENDVNSRVRLSSQWKSGNNWYRKYSDGFIIQGGSVSQSGSSGTVKFNIAFTSTPSVVFQRIVGVCENSLSSVSTTQFAWVSNTSRDGTTHWMACGI